MDSYTISDRSARVGAARDALADLRGDGALLDLGKKKSAGWRPGDDLPDGWGADGGSCGGTVARREDEEGVHYVPVLCKRWSCPVCCFYRYGWLVRNVVAAMDAHELRYFWTLTLSTKGRSADDSFRDLQVAWKRLLRRLERRYGHMTFVWVVETTKQGYAHMHLLVNKFLRHSDVSRWWLEITGDSKVVHVERLHGKEAAKYLAKYVAKEARLRAEGKSRLSDRHLFGRSQNVEFDDFMPGSKGWTVLEVSWRANAAWLRRNCPVLVDRMAPTPRMTVPSANGNDYLKSWDVPLSGEPPPPLPDVDEELYRRYREAWLEEHPRRAAS